MLSKLFCGYIFAAQTFLSIAHNNTKFFAFGLEEDDFQNFSNSTESCNFRRKRLASISSEALKEKAENDLTDQIPSIPKRYFFVALLNISGYLVWNDGIQYNNETSFPILEQQGQELSTCFALSKDINDSFILYRQSCEYKNGYICEEISELDDTTTQNEIELDIKLTYIFTTIMIVVIAIAVYIFVPVEKLKWTTTHQSKLRSDPPSKIKKEKASEQNEDNLDSFDVKQDISEYESEEQDLAEITNQIYAN